MSNLNSAKLQLESGIRNLIKHFDEDPNREGLEMTPMRYVKFLDEFLKKDKKFRFTTFNKEDVDEMIVVKDIPFYSLCEHHLVPFFGTATIAYIPSDKIVGLSKIPRCVDYYARRFQNQERITTQIADRIQRELNPYGVAVVLKAEHLCMAMRGIKKPGCLTITSKMLGFFKNDPKCRNEFMNLIQ